MSVQSPPSVAESPAEPARPPETSGAAVPAVPNVVAPRVSVVVACYESQRTLARSLRSMLAQSHGAYEVVVVDSSPTESCAEIVRRDFPGVRLLRSAERLLPHAARNLGAAHAQGELLVFTDPDVYAPPDWLRRMEAAHADRGGVIVGALACHGRRWLDRGIHLVKFSKWLPGRAPQPVDVSPTANMLCPRELFDAAGGFPGDHLLGDATFSWGLRRRGVRLHLHSAAAVEHHHLDSWRGFLRERWRRGILYGELRLAAGDWGGRGPALRLAVLPLRLASNLIHTARHAGGAGELGWLLATAPVVVAGHVVSLAGEAVSYWRAAWGREARSR